MKIRIDATKCEAYGACAEHLPEVITLDEWGYASVIGDGIVEDEGRGRRAVKDCPAGAVIEVESDGS